ncbi:uncharacterized protein [Clytia hemisphaerica]|uniref:ILEI/PANDER domain-containing protein n=1 Tax=Clytia hemisphaerica TaxID=252671 RepID=A0A7M5TZM1_9CNID
MNLFVCLLLACLVVVNTQNVPLGFTYSILSEGCNDRKVAGCGLASIYRNGGQLSLRRRGYNFVAFSSVTGNYHSRASFDTFANKDACRQMYNWIRSRPTQTVVLGAIQDEGSVQFVPGYCDKALELIGGQKPFQRQYRGSFAIAGYRGLPKPYWARQQKLLSSEGPLRMSGFVQIPVGGISYRVFSQGCEDPGIPSGTCGVARINLNNQFATNLAPRGRGYNFVAINSKSGLVLESRSFDTFCCSINCKRMYDWIKALNPQTIVLGAIQDEANSKFNNDCKNALALIGASYSSGYRGSHSIIGYRGNPKPTWIRHSQRTKTNGPTVLSGYIQIPV